MASCNDVGDSAERNSASPCHQKYPPRVSSKIPIRAATPDSRTSKGPESGVKLHGNSRGVYSATEQSAELVNDNEHNSLSNRSQRSTRAATNLSPSVDKPLPQTPVVRVSGTSPEKSARTLLDATDKPLRRSPGTVEEEDWPVLTPQKTPPLYASGHSDSQSKQNRGGTGLPRVNHKRRESAISNIVNSYGGLENDDDTDRFERSRPTSRKSSRHDPTLYQPTLDGLHYPRYGPGLAQRSYPPQQSSRPKVRPPYQRDDTLPTLDGRSTMRNDLNGSPLPSVGRRGHDKQLGSRVVRLSQGEAAPYGPTLTIAKHADRVLMGPAENDFVLNRLRAISTPSKKRQAEPNSRINAGFGTLATQTTCNSSTDLSKSKGKSKLADAPPDTAAKTYKLPEDAGRTNEFRIRRPSSPHANVLIGTPSKSNLKAENGKLNAAHSTMNTIRPIHREASSRYLQSNIGWENEKSSPADPYGNTSYSFPLATHQGAATKTAFLNYGKEYEEANKVTDRSMPPRNSVDIDASHRSKGAESNVVGADEQRPSETSKPTQLPPVPFMHQVARVPRGIDRMGSPLEERSSRSENMSSNTKRSRPESRSRAAIANIKGILQKRIVDPMNSKKRIVSTEVTQHATGITESPTRTSAMSTPSKRTMQATNFASNPTISSLGPRNGNPSDTEPCPLQQSTSKALAILDQAMSETSAARKKDLLSLAQVMIDTITSAREAEKSMHAAQQAANDAKASYEMTRRSVVEMSNMFSKAGTTLGIRKVE